MQKTCFTALPVRLSRRMITFACHVVALSTMENLMALSKLQKVDKNSVTLKKKQVQTIEMRRHFE